MIYKSNKAHLEDLLRCYDDANLLFPSNLREEGSLEIMAQVLNENEVFHIMNHEEIIGWIAYKIENKISILDGLYVKRAYHGQKTAIRLVEFYFEKLYQEKVHYSILSYLKFAPWAKKFYKKAGYIDTESVTDISNQLKEIIRKKQRSYSQVMIKSMIDDN